MLSDIKTEEDLIKELRTHFSFSKGENSAHGEKGWLNNNIRLKHLVMNEDPRSFLQWDVMKKTMVVENADFVEIELDYLRSRNDWPRYEKAIQEVPVGQPTFSNIYPESSGNLIHHAYHVAQFENITSSNINDIDFITSVRHILV
jgi:hypothetical protein